MSRLKVGIDVDGVLTSAAGIMVDLINEHPEHNHSLSRAGITGYDWDFYKSYCEPCFYGLLHNPEFARRCVLYPGTYEALELMSRYVDLYLMTHRHELIQPATIEWLQTNHIYNLFTNVWFERKSKAKKAVREGLDFHIDDSPNVINDWNTRRANNGEGFYPELVIYDCNYNSGLPGLRVSNLANFATLVVGYAKALTAAEDA